ncbi:MAG: hypothetical protein ABW166_02950 [Sedimenticola sp.]
MKEGETSISKGDYLVTDGETRLTTRSLGSGYNDIPAPGKIIDTIEFSAIDGAGNSILFRASMTEDSVIVEPQGEVATQLAEARSDLVLGMTMAELQKNPEFVIGDVDAFFFGM